MAEEGEENVGKDDEVRASHGCPEVVGHKTVEGEVILEFFDPVLGVRPSAVGFVNHSHGQAEIGHEAAAAVFPEVRMVLEQAELFTILPTASGRISISCLTITLLGLVQESFANIAGKAMSHFVDVGL